MKKSILFIITLLLILPISVFAITYPKVLTLTAEVDGNKINYSGTIENGSHAVMCKLYNSQDEEIDKLSVAVNNFEFEGMFTTTTTGNYKVACANYEGGEIKTTNVSIEEEPTYYTVTFNLKGASLIEPVEVLEGQKVSKPTPDPTNGDKVFGGWFEDDTFTREFDFNTPITSDIVLFAYWTDQEMVRVDFDTRCEQGIDPVEIISGQKVNKPTPDPTNGDRIFGGWFEDDTFTREFDFNTPITSDIVLFAYWVDPEQGEDPARDTSYTVEDDNENIISFKEEAGHTYHFEMIDYLSFTKEEVMAATNITSEEYDQIFSGIKEQAEKKGTFLFFFDISVYELVTPDPNDPEDDGRRDIHEGPFTIKIRMTDELAKYTSFKMYYVNEYFNLDNEPSVFYVSEDGKYLLGNVKHLSPYVLVGNVSSNTSGGTTTGNPQTGDNIYIWYGLFVISIFGLSIGAITAARLKKNQQIRLIR